MTIESSFIPLSRLRPMFELSREDGSSGSASGQGLRRNGLGDRNELSPDQAVALSRAIRAKALKPFYPDSTASIRKDRDSR